MKGSSLHTPDKAEPVGTCSIAESSRPDVVADVSATEADIVWYGPGEIVGLVGPHYRCGCRTGLMVHLVAPY
jgi:hypothetical protein